ncbi:PAS domain S-box protein [Verrucomicrobia bacterium S94]|nr:PAS domain S-box protein [Verrucomicrobia bacterium S94]
MKFFLSTYGFQRFFDGLHIPHVRGFRMYGMLHLVVQVLMLHLFVPHTVVAEEPVPDTYRILFVSHKTELPPWNLAMFSECRSEFERLSGRPVSMIIKSMDRKGPETPAAAGNQLYLSDRVEGVDFMVYRNPLSSPPLHLAAEEGVPLIVPACDTASLTEPGKLPANVYLKTVTLSPARTAGLVKRLCPDVGKLIVIGGDHETDRFLMRRAREELGENYGGLAVEYWEGLRPADLKKRAAALSRDTAILFLKMTLDPNGAIHISSDIVRDLLAYTPVPVFGISDTFVEEGILGGYVASSRMEGRRAAQMLALLADGNSVPPIEHVEDYGEYQFNWHQLKRWGIRESQLPVGSRILYRPDSLFERHPWLLQAIWSSFIGLVLILCVTLLFLLSRRKTLRVLRENEEWLRLSTGTAGVVAWEYDWVNDRMACSQHHELLYGLKPQSPWTKVDFLNAIHPDDREFVDGAIAQSIAPGSSGEFRFDCRTLWPDGSVHWLLMTGEATARNAEGGAVLMRGCMMDITERKMMEMALRASKEKERLMAKLVMDSNQPVAIGFADGRLGRFNPAFCELTGYTEEELKHIDWATELTPPEWLEAERRALAVLVRTGEPVRYEKEYIRKDGSRVSVSLFTHLSRSVDGIPDYFYAFISDITELKRVREEVLKEKNRLQFALEVSHMGAWDLNLSDLSSHRTKTHDEVFGYKTPVPEWTYEMFLEHVLPEEREEVNRKFQTAITTGEDWSFECRIRRADGKVRWIWAVGRPAGGNQGLMGGVVQDITERKQTELALKESHDLLEVRVEERTAELKERRDEAEQLNRAMINLLQDLKQTNRGLKAAEESLRTTNKELEAFSYSVSHDLRAPLRHIAGFVELLLKREKGRLDERSEHYLLTIDQSVKRMGQLIDDLLALSRMSRSDMHFCDVDMNEVVRNALKELAHMKKERSIVWNIVPMPSVTADPRLLLQVWINLIGNALKFTARKKEAVIEIGILDKEEVKEENQAVFYIRDNGAGFEPEYAHKLFGVFQRLHREDEFEGTGIGLATVRRIIHRHGGKVWAEGAVDRGAAFYFTLGKNKGEK